MLPVIKNSLCLQIGISDHFAGEGTFEKFANNRNQAFTFMIFFHIQSKYKMHFKLSVRELEILDKDRIKILKRLRQSHLNGSTHQPSSSAKRPMKPPILVVPLDESRLFCVIQTCDDFDHDEEQNSNEDEVVIEKPIRNKCCEGSIRRKQSRKNLATAGQTETSREIIANGLSSNTQDNNVPTKMFDQICPANIEQDSEVKYFEFIYILMTFIN